MRLDAKFLETPGDQVVVLAFNVDDWNDGHFLFEFDCCRWLWCDVVIDS